MIAIKSFKKRKVMKHNKLILIYAMTLTMPSGFLMASAKVTGNARASTRTSSGQFENPAASPHTQTGQTTPAQLNTQAAMQAKFAQQHGNQVIGGGAVTHLQPENNIKFLTETNAPSSVKAPEAINSQSFSSKAKQATISAAEAAKQAAISAAKAVIDIPASIKHVYDSYNKDANVGGQTGWNFSTLTNRPIAIPKNQNSYIMNQPSIGKTSSAEITIDNSRAEPTAESTIKSPNDIRLENNMKLAQQVDKLSNWAEATFKQKPIKNINEPIQPDKTTEQPTQKIQNKPTAPDYATALGDSRPLRSLFAQPEIKLSQEALDFRKNNSRTITSTTKSAAARNKARVDAKNKSKFAEQKTPVETPVQKQQAQEPLVESPNVQPKKLQLIASDKQTINKSSQLDVYTTEINNNGAKEFTTVDFQQKNKPQQSQESQQNQVTIIPGQGVRDHALPQNFRELNLESVKNGQTEIAQQNKAQAYQQATNPVDTNFKYDDIYTNTAQAQIPYPTKRYTGNEHLKNYSKNSRAEITQQKAALEKQNDEAIHDVVDYTQIYPDNTNYTAFSTVAEQYKTPSRTPAATEFLGSQMRNKNLLENRQKATRSSE